MCFISSYKTVHIDNESYTSQGCLWLVAWQPSKVTLMLCKSIAQQGDTMWAPSALLCVCTLRWLTLKHWFCRIISKSERPLNIKSWCSSYTVESLVPVQTRGVETDSNVQERKLSNHRNILCSSFVPFPLWLITSLINLVFFDAPEGFNGWWGWLLSA